MSDISNLINDTLYGIEDSSRHIMTLFSLCLSLKAKNVLELGVRKGITTIPLLQAMKYTNGILTSVDIQENSNLNYLKNNSNWKYVISDSIKFLENIKSTEIYDLILIDDWHDGEHVYKEIQLLESHITPNSLILLHDCMCYNTQPNYHLYLDKDGEFGNGGPFSAILKLNLDEWEYSTIPVSHGLTFLRKKGNLLKY